MKKAFAILAIVALVLLFLAACAPAPEAGASQSGDMTAETLALFIAGVVAVPLLTQAIKKLGLSGIAVWWVAFVLSALVATIAELTVNGLVDMPSLAADPTVWLIWVGGRLGIVFGLSQLVYKNITAALSQSKKPS